MGRGKNKDNSESAYSEGKNTVIDNKVYMTKQRVLTEEMREEKARNDGSKVKEEAYNKHSINFYTKYFKNTSNKVKLTRIASTVKGTQAVEKFRTLVKGYENNNNSGSLCHAVCGISEKRGFRMLWQENRGSYHKKCSCHSADVLYAFYCGRTHHQPPGGLAGTHLPV